MMHSQKQNIGTTAVDSSAHTNEVKATVKLTDEQIANFEAHRPTPLNQLVVGKLVWWNGRVWRIKSVNRQLVVTLESVCRLSKQWNEDGLFWYSDAFAFCTSNALYERNTAESQYWSEINIGYKSKSPTTALTETQAAEELQSFDNLIGECFTTNEGDTFSIFLITKSVVIGSTDIIAHAHNIEYPWIKEEFELEWVLNNCLLPAYTK